MTATLLHFKASIVSIFRRGEDAAMSLCEMFSLH